MQRVSEKRKPLVLVGDVIASQMRQRVYPEKLVDLWFDTYSGLKLNKFGRPV